MSGEQLFIDFFRKARGWRQAFFAVRLTSVGVCDRNHGLRAEYAARLLNRQADFIAMLPSLGQGNAVELCFVGRPQRNNPALGQVDVFLRVRVSGAGKMAARSAARGACRELMPNLLSISDSYHWEPVVDEAEYRRVFHDFEPRHIAELTQREALIGLDRVGMLPQRRAIGFTQPEERADESSLGEDPQVYFVFPFIRSFERLERLFGVLLMQPAPVALSVALSPTNLTTGELDFLARQMQQCERYLQLPLDGPISRPSRFLPPLKTQATRLLEGIQRMAFGLRDDCFDVRILAASQQPLAPALMEALGVSITEHAASTDSESDVPHDSTPFAGGFDWRMAGDDATAA